MISVNGLKLSKYLPIICLIPTTTVSEVMTVITGFSNKKFFELISNGGELKVTISKEDYDAYCDYEKHIDSNASQRDVQLGEPWEIVVKTVYSLGGNINYTPLANEKIEATIYIKLSNQQKTLSGYK